MDHKDLPIAMVKLRIQRAGGEPYEKSLLGRLLDRYRTWNKSWRSHRRAITDGRGRVEKEEK